VLQSVLGPAGSARVDVAVAQASLFIGSAHVVSDRGAADPRATANAVMLPAAGSVESVLAEAPPGLYSAVVLDLGDGVHPGVEIFGSFNGAPLNVMLQASGIVVRCSPAVRLEPGGTVQLSLGALSDGWLDSVDLQHAVSDGDERGLLIDADDNAALAPIILSRVAASFSLDCR